jgi:hypothetical protein
LRSRQSRTILIFLEPRISGPIASAAGLRSRRDPKVEDAELRNAQPVDVLEVVCGTRGVVLCIDFYWNDAAAPEEVDGVLRFAVTIVESLLNVRMISCRIGVFENRLLV